MLASAYACEGEVCYGYHQNNNANESQAYYTIDDILALLNAGYIDFDESGHLFIVNPLLNGHLSHLTNRVSFVVDSSYEEICCDYHADSDYICFTPFAPSGSCSNIFGHSWGAWGRLETVGAVSHSNNCGITRTCVSRTERRRWCTRNLCSRYYLEQGTIFILC